MINKKELRIGNLLKCGDNIVEVEDIGETGVNLIWYHELTRFDYDYNQLSPIELTPEWLEDMGFQRLYKDRWNHQKYGVDVEKYCDKGYILLAEEMSNWSRYYKYVHEIQNLVYILTGKELTITSFNQSN